MSETVNCAYARVAVQTLITKHSIAHRGLLADGMIKVHCDFLTQFKTFDLVTAKKRFKLVRKAFNKRWHPDNAKSIYMSTFAASKWNALRDIEKKQHTMRNCQACQSMYGNLIDLFPGSSKHRRHVGEQNEITIVTQPDISTQQAGKQILHKIGAFVERQYGTSLQDVLINTPKSGLIRKPTSAERLQSKRKMEPDFRDRIQTEYKRMTKS